MGYFLLFSITTTAITLISILAANEQEVVMVETIEKKEEKVFVQEKPTVEELQMVA